VKIDKDTIIGMLRDRGDHGQADEASRELPDEVDHEKDAGLLGRFGLNPQELLKKIGGGGGLGGLLGKDKG
jgi:hypothetical protein